LKLVGYKYQLQNKQQKNNMTDYKALYEQQLQENKKLQEENANWEADDANLTKVLNMLNELDEDFPVSGVDDMYEYVKELIKEHKELKKKEQEYQPKGSRIDAEGLHDYMKEENKKLKKEVDKWCEIISSLDGDDWSDMLQDAGWEYNDENELVRVEEEYEITEENIIRDYGDESLQAKQYGFGMYNPEYVKRLKEKQTEPASDSESEDEEEVDKYDGDDWCWVYGKEKFRHADEVVLIMAGGGDHWENWVMTPNMNYIVNKDGKHPQNGKVLVQSSCGKYVSFQDEDYECEGDECICEYEYCVDC
jgi:FtsZ-binding cell division protein ZapB